MSEPRLSLDALTAEARERHERRRPGIVHLGLGAFHRSHQAWYTQNVGAASAAIGEKPAGGGDAGGSQDHDGEAPWGIVAFTGRSPGAATELAAQQGVYTLIERSASADTATLIDTILKAHDGSDVDAWRAAVASADTAIVTLTVTEAAYLRSENTEGGVDFGAGAVAADVTTLRTTGDDADAACTTVPGRLVDGLRARRRAGAGPLAVLSCDNLTGNGDVARRVVTSLADAVDDELADWIRQNVSFVSSMVDRITPATTDADRDDALRLTGYDDHSVVVAEPFAEWVIADSSAAFPAGSAFPAGRPAWETAGVRFVDDIVPYEHRKLWLLNAGHSLLAYLGLLLGHETVDEAVADPRCREPLEQLWNEAADVLPLPGAEIDDARAALRTRFENPRIRHRLRQIAADGSVKLPERVIAPLTLRLDRGLDIGDGATTALAGWAVHLARQPELVRDPGATGLVAPDGAAANGTPPTVLDVLRAIAPNLADRPDVVAAVESAAARILTLLPPPALSEGVTE